MVGEQIKRVLKSLIHQIKLYTIALNNLFTFFKQGTFMLNISNTSVCIQSMTLECTVSWDLIVIHDTIILLVLLYGNTLKWT